MKRFRGMMSLVCLIGSVPSEHDFRSRYPRLESYEIRPGVLVMPKYAKDGTVCELSIEKLHVQGDTVDLGSSMSQESVMNMIDELAPAAERGKAIIQTGGFDYITNGFGRMAITSAEYENVSIHIYGTRSSPISGNVAVILHWKAKTCGSQDGASSASQLDYFGSRYIAP